MARTPRHFELHIYIATLFLALIVAFAIVNTTMQYLQARQMILSASEVLFRHIGTEVKSAVGERYDTSTFAVDLLAKSAITGARSLPERLERLPLLVQVLRDRPSLASAYIGYDDGDFYLVRQLAPDSSLGRSLQAPPASAYLVQSVERSAGGPQATRYVFFDDALTKIGDKTAPGDAMDPRGRPWFVKAMRGSGSVVTKPYVFFTTHEIGTTFARRSADGHSVAGVDVTLATLSDLMRSLRPTKSAELAIVDERGDAIAGSDLTQDQLADWLSGGKQDNLLATQNPVLAKIAGTTTVGLVSVKARDDVWEGLVAHLATPQAPLYLAIAAPRSELLADAVTMRNASLLMAFVVMLVVVPLTLACSRLASQPLGALTREAAAIRALKFDQPAEVRTFVSEIHLLAQTMDSMKSTIRRFLEIGAALAGERHFDRLLQRLLAETMALVGARGGAVYLSQPDGMLHCALARWDDATCNILPASLGPDADDSHPVIEAIAEGSRVETLRSDDITRWYPGFVHSGALTTLAVPLRNRQGDVVGALLLARDEEAPKEAEQQDVLALVEAVAGTAATAIESQRLLLEQKRLMEALIELVAGAIDRKSAYTGGHCARVPALAEMLARAAEAAPEGPFKDFALSEEQWEELHIAAWLHDCGKVTTPEFVVDKATKLETIYDRLHEIRMRFEVLKREAEIEAWRAIADGAPREERLAALRASWGTLDDEFAFVATCNEGGEFMAPEKIERLRRIAARQWTRTLDDRIGLSFDERERKNATPAAALPALEPLLADKPEHIFERQEGDRIAADNPWGFKIAVPERLYNRGELYNLSIGRGTLTAEDRYKINEHIVETVRMLSRLPWPPQLSHVVEIACGHHEKMDGTGYPRRLKRDQMSVPARMMAIADIFEALTAADRPYKAAKTLSESLAIMARMRDEAHIDPEIFDLFISAGVYRSYAEQFLRSDQIDEVDATRYLQPA